MSPAPARIIFATSIVIQAILWSQSRYATHTTQQLALRNDANYYNTPVKRHFDDFLMTKGNYSLFNEPEKTVRYHSWTVRVSLIDNHPILPLPIVQIVPPTRLPSHRAMSSRARELSRIRNDARGKLYSELFLHRYPPPATQIHLAYRLASLPFFNSRNHGFRILHPQPRNNI